MQLGSRSGVPVLLSTLEKFFPGAPLGAFYLSKFGIEEAALDHRCRADLWRPYLLADVKELAGQHAAANSEGTSISLDQEPH